MTTVFLVRHGAHDLLGRVLAGRMSGVPLNAEGQRQADRVGRRLAREALSGLFTSPSERAHGTALPLSALSGLPARVAEAFHEIDVGDWTGLGFEALAADPAWAAWNERRGTARCPGGESFDEVQRRAVAGLRVIAQQHPDGRIAVFSHADVIKAMLMDLLGIPLDGHGRFDIDPGSISTAVFGAWGGKVLRLNEEAAP